jgi:hypothetical protein
MKAKTSPRLIVGSANRSGQQTQHCIRKTKEATIERTQLTEEFRCVAPEGDVEVHWDRFLQYTKQNADVALLLGGHPDISKHGHFLHHAQQVDFFAGLDLADVAGVM